MHRCSFAYYYYTFLPVEFGNISKLTLFRMIYFVSYMHCIRMPFQIALSDSDKCTLTNVQNILSG